MVGGGVGAALVVRAVQCSFRCLDPAGRRVGLLRSRCRGQRDLRSTSGEQSRRGLNSPELELGHDSGEAMAWGRCRGRREFSGAMAELLRWSAGARRQWSGVSMAARRHGVAE